MRLVTQQPGPPRPPAPGLVPFAPHPCCGLCRLDHRWEAPHRPLESNSLAWAAGGEACIPNTFKSLGQSFLATFVGFCGSLWATRGSGYGPDPQRGLRISLSIPMPVLSGTARARGRRPLQHSFLLHKVSPFPHPSHHPPLNYLEKSTAQFSLV